MELRKCKLSVEEVVGFYNSGIKIKDIQESSGISRVAIYDILKREGIFKNRREILVMACLFCEELFERPRSQMNGEGGYCSVACFHADRSLVGEYSKIGGALSRVDLYPSGLSDRQLGRKARKALSESGIILKSGEVVHHKNGDRRDWSKGNLEVFKNQSEHMKFHHRLRMEKRK